MKKNMGFGEEGFQGFVIQHVEKCVLGVIILLVGYLVFSGSSAQNVLDIEKDQLLDSANRADGHIKNSQWDEKSRKPAGSDIASQISQRELVIHSESYSTKPWNPQLVPHMSARIDPALFAPENIRVTPLYGPMVLKVDPAATAAPGDRVRGGRNSDLDDGALGSLPVVIGTTGSTYSGSGYIESPVENRPAPRTPAGKGPAGKRRPSRDDNPYGDSGPGPSAVASAPRTVSTERTVPPEALHGLRPKDSQVKLQAAYAMVVTATVPFEKQWRAYEKAFSRSMGGQNPKRDVPMYLGVACYRADVTDDPAAEPTKWERITKPGERFSAFTSLRELEKKYGAFAFEPSDPEALDGSILHPVPPFLLTDMKNALIHPAIPLARDRKVETVVADPVNPVTRPTPEGDDSGFSSGPDDPNAPPGYGSGSGEMGRVPGPVPPGYAGGPEGRAGRMTQMYQRTTLGDNMVPPANYDNVDIASFTPPAKRLIRFVDYDVRPGRKYRYKLQLGLSDPNRPVNTAMAPPLETLDDQAQKRVKAADAADAKVVASGKRRPPPHRLTEFSPPSEVVSIDRSERFYGSDTEATPLASLREFKVPNGEPKAKVVAVSFNEKLAAFVPILRSVQRASFLAGPHDVEILHPVVGDVRKFSEYPQNSKALVLDIGGGEFLPGTDPKNPQRAPGEALLLDRQGRLVAVDGVSDVDALRRYVFPEVKKEGPANASPIDDLSPPGGGEFGLEGYPTPPRGRAGK